MGRTVVLIFAIFLLLMSGGNVSAVPRLLAAPQQPRDERPRDPTLEKMQKDAEKKRNEQRQSDLKRDTDQLYKLAAELKKSVDTTDEHVLSLEVIKNAEEIEKFAKSVRTKMRVDGYCSTGESWL